MADGLVDYIKSACGTVCDYVIENGVGEICRNAALGLPVWLYHILKTCLIEVLRVRTLGIIVLLLFIFIIVLQVARLFYMKSTMRTTTLTSGSNFSVRRFRKRDKLRYYYERMFRKFRRRLREKAAGRDATLSNNLSDSFAANAASLKTETPPERRKRITKRRFVTDFARTIFRPAGFKPTSINLMPETLPANLLVEENDGGIPVSKAASKFEFVLPREIIAMMRAVRVLGHFEEPVYVELLKRMETIELEYGQYLFKTGDPDDSIYMVQQGRLLLYIETPKQPSLSLSNTGSFARIEEHAVFGREGTPPRSEEKPGRPRNLNRPAARGHLSSRMIRFPLKIIEKGEPINSLLSILDVLTGHARPFRTLNAKALEKSTVLRLPVSVLNNILEKDNESLMRVVQIIMSRLQRVTFMALHRYLGLTHELLSSHAAASSPMSTNLIGNIPRPETMPEKKQVDIKITHAASEHEPRFRKRGYSTDEQMSAAGFYPTPKTFASLRAQLMPLRSSPIGDEENSDDEYDNILRQNTSINPASLCNVSDTFFRNDESPLSSEDSDSDDILRHDGTHRHGGGSAYAFLQRSRSFGGSDLVDIPRDARFNDALKILTDLLQLDEPIEGTADDIAAEDSRGTDRQMLRYIRVATDTRIIHEQEPDSGVAFVVSGGLLLTQQTVEPSSGTSHHKGLSNSHKFGAGGLAPTETRHDSPVMRLGPGRMAGVLAVLSGEPSVFTFRAYEPSKLIYITRSDMYELIKRRPHIVLPLAHAGTTAALTPFVRQVDFAIDWLHVEAGRALYRQGDDAGCIYIVLSGRLRSIISRQTAVTTSSATSSTAASPVHRKASHFRRQSTMQWQHESPPNVVREIVGEFGRGELVGLVEVSLGQPRMTTVMAVRDSEVARLPAQVLELMKVRYPKVVTRLIHILARSTLGGLSRNATGSGSTTSRVDAAIISIATASGGGVGNPEGGISSSDGSSAATENSPHQQNLATVAIYAANERVPLDSFTLELELSIRPLKPCLRVTSEFIVNLLGTNALSERIGNYRLSAWLDRQEDHHLLILQCDRGLTQWTKHCFRQADLVIMLANGIDDPNVVGAFETQLEGENLNIRARRDLVLLYHMDKQFPKNTAAWVQKRPWVARYHHIKCHRRIFRNRSLEKLEELYYRSGRIKPEVFSDFSRLARHITCQQVGLVLGGGGARGAAHVGVIKCLLENGIPIDMVGGTSMGAFVGAIWAQDRDLTRCVQDTRTWFQGAASLWKTLVDITYPITALFSGVVFNASIEDVFEDDRQIEDLWLPYFCVSTDITTSQMRVHTCGSLWRYVRASMTLAGYLPPICDPRDSHLLVDGGYVNNLPADVMRQLGASIVIACDVSSKWELEVDNYGDAVSGWWLLANKWNPFTKRVRIPSMGEIQTRLAFVSCVRQMELIKRSKFMIYIRPPVERYETLQFKEFDGIMDVGYKYASKFFSDAESSKRVAELFRFPSVATNATASAATVGAASTPAEATNKEDKFFKSTATAPINDNAVTTAATDTADAAALPATKSEQHEMSSGSDAASSAAAAANRKKAGNLLSAMWAEKDRIASGQMSDGKQRRTMSPSRLEHRDSLGAPTEMVSQQPESATGSNTTAMYGNRRRLRGHSSEGSRKSESEAESSEIRQPITTAGDAVKAERTNDDGGIVVKTSNDAQPTVLWPKPAFVRYDNGDAGSLAEDLRSNTLGVKSSDTGVALRGIVRKPLLAYKSTASSGKDVSSEGRRASSADRSSSVSPRKGVAFTLPTTKDAARGKAAEDTSLGTPTAAADDDEKG